MSRHSYSAGICNCSTDCNVPACHAMRSRNANRAVVGLGDRIRVTDNTRVGPDYVVRKSAGAGDRFDLALASQAITATAQTTPPPDGTTSRSSCPAPWRISARSPVQWRWSSSMPEPRSEYGAPATTPSPAPGAGGRPASRPGQRYDPARIFGDRYLPLVLGSRQRRSGLAGSAGGVFCVRANRVNQAVSGGYGERDGTGLQAWAYATWHRQVPTGVPHGAGQDNPSLSCSSPGLPFWLAASTGP